MLRQIVLNNPVGISHFERLYEYAPEQTAGRRFMRASCARRWRRPLPSCNRRRSGELTAEALRASAGLRDSEVSVGDLPESITREVLVGAVREWLGVPTIADATWAQLTSAARLTASVLDLGGWHARRPGGRNYDWDNLMLHLETTLGGEAKGGPIDSIVEELRAEVVERLRQVEDGEVTEAEGGETPPLPKTETELSTEELGEIVQAWLEARIEENEFPDDRESQRLVLRGVLSSRTNGFAPHWKSLRAFGEWPEGIEQDVMLEGVRAALAKLAPDADAAPSWAGVRHDGVTHDGLNPVVPAYARPRPMPDDAVSGRLLQRKNEVIDRLLTATDRALGYLRRLEREGDEELVETIAGLEVARAEALSVD